jgi:hypothetical protein
VTRLPTSPLSTSMPRSSEAAGRYEFLDAVAAVVSLGSRWSRCAGS